jgi:uncharacterized protein (TIRG00374 family)
VSPQAPAREADRVRARRGGLARFAFDWRVWFGLLVTAVALYWTLRDVPLRELGASLASAHTLPLLLMIPFHWLGLWFRAVRWRHLAAPIAQDTLPLGALYRATAVGFMTINIFPLRIGELVRPWVLSRETNVRGSAALGTLVLERAIDFTMLAAIGALVLSAHTATLPGWVRSGAGVFAVLSCVPFVLALALRRNEEATIVLLGRLASALPGHTGERALDLIAEVCRGLGALQGRRAILVVLGYSVFIWGCVFAAPFALGLLAFGIDLPPGRFILATYTTLAFTALAIATPSAPGFVGVYHFACRESLKLFGIPSATAVAYGTALHLFYWFPVTLFGLLAALRTGARLSELASPEFGKAHSGQHR